MGRPTRPAARRGDPSRPSNLAAVRLYDTFSRLLVELPPAPGPVRMYFSRSDRLRTGARRQRTPFLVGMWLRSWLRETGYDATLVHNITDINDKIYNAAPGASAVLAAQATEWYLRDTGDLGLGHRTTCRERQRRFRRSSSSSKSWSRPGMRTPWAVTSTFASRAFRHTGGFRGRAAGPGRGAGAEPAEGGRSGLRALEGEQAGDRGHVVGVAWGGGRPGWHIECSAMAEEIFGLRSRSTAAGSTSSFPITRTRWRSPARSGIRSRRSGRTTGCSVSPARIC